MIKEEKFISISSEWFYLFGHRTLMSTIQA